jgi:hypothetical protein
LGIEGCRNEDSAMDLQKEHEEMRKREEKSQGKG